MGIQLPLSSRNRAFVAAIIKKAMKEVNTAPTTKINMPTKIKNWVRVLVKPTVKVPVAEAKLKPKRLPYSKRNSVEATLKIKVAMIKPV